MLDNNDLVSIYNKVKNEINLIADDDKSIRSGAGQQGMMGNAMSLRLSTEASI